VPVLVADFDFMRERARCRAAWHPILCRMLFDHPDDHPDDPSGSVWSRLDRRGIQREQARSVWSRPDRRRASVSSSEGRGFESLLGLQNRRSEGIWGIAHCAVGTGGHSFEFAQQAVGAPAPLRYVGVPPTSRLVGLGRRKLECRWERGRPAQRGGRSWVARFMQLRRHSFIQRAEFFGCLIPCPPGSTAITSGRGVLSQRCSASA